MIQFLIICFLYIVVGLTIFTVWRVFGNATKDEYPGVTFFWPLFLLVVFGFGIKLLFDKYLEGVDYLKDKYKNRGKNKPIRRVSAHEAFKWETATHEETLQHLNEMNTTFMERSRILDMQASVRRARKSKSKNKKTVVKIEPVKPQEQIQRINMVE